MIITATTSLLSSVTETLTRSSPPPSSPSSCDGSSPVENGVLSVPRLLDFVSALDEDLVKSASRKDFKSLPDISKAISELTVLKGVGTATASAILAAYAPDVAPFMSDEAMEAAFGNSNDYTAKQYLLFADKLQTKTNAIEHQMEDNMQELSTEEATFTPSDVERALWNSAVGTKLLSSKSDPDHKTYTTTSKSSRGKRKR